MRAKAGAVAVAATGVLRATTAMVLTTAIGAFVAAPTPAASQNPAGPPWTGVPSDRAAAPYLPPDHWALDALRRLDGLGLIEGYQPSLPGVDRVEAAWFLSAAARAVGEDGAGEGSGGAPLAVLTSGFVARFRAEFPVAAERAGGGGGAWAVGGGKVGVGFVASDGVMLTTVGTPPLVEQPWEPEQPAELSDGSEDPLGLLEVSGYAGRVAAAEIGLMVRGDALRVSHAELVGALGPVTGWAGRRRVRIGYGDGVVMASGAAPIDGGGVEIEPFRLPWVLRHLGPIGVATSLGRLEYTAPYDDPWFWLFRATVQPHPRLTFGLNRSAMAVAVEGGLGERLQQILYIAIGKHMGDAEDNWRDNQMGSVDVRYRPPLGPAAPVTLHLEWGFDDSAGSWIDVPGLVGGVYLAAVPGAPWLAAGIEASHFAERCCGNIWWYRHSGFTGGWSDERRPVGHPLGGHGSEWAGQLEAAVLRGMGLVEARIYLRDRGEENLFSPTFQGGSTGGEVGFSGAIGRDLELRLSAEYERGERDWSRTAGQVTLSLIF